MKLEELFEVYKENIMPTYNCDCCKFSTLLKINYNYHLKTNKHMGNVSIKLAQS